MTDDPDNQEENGVDKKFEAERERVFGRGYAHMTDDEVSRDIQRRKREARERYARLGLDHTGKPIKKDKG